MAKQRIRPVRRFGRRKSTTGDFQDHIIGTKTRRRQKLRRALRGFLIAALLAGALLAGFCVTEVLLQVSELPPAAAQTKPDQTPAKPQITTAPAKPRPPDLRALYAPVAMLDTLELTGRVIKTIQESDGANAAVVMLKDDRGLLSYRSNLDQQRILRASRQARQNVEACLAEFKARNIRVVAWVHCFRDNIAAASMLDGAVLRQDSARPAAWRDASGNRWLNPYAKAARNYLCGVIRELAALGADDILLDSVCFPEGGLEGAVFPGEKNPGDLGERNQALREFLRQAKEAAGEARLLCVMPADVALNGGERFGGDLWNSAADCVAVDTRGTPWVLDADWGGRPTVQIFASPAEAENRKAFLIIEPDRNN